MGCSCNRSKESEQSEEEAILIGAEKLLDMSRLNPNLYDKAISRYAMGEYINAQQLKAAYESLRLDHSFLDTENSVTSFYQSFWSKSADGYKVTSLVCAGIWLGDENPRNKAVLLFKNYDRNCSNSLELDEFTMMIDDMMDITCMLIELGKKVNARKGLVLENYSKKLRKNKEFLISNFWLLLAMGNEDKSLSPMEFENAFNDSTISKLSSPRGFRDQLIEYNDMQFEQSKRA